jgi:ankyrin repeat protein
VRSKNFEIVGLLLRNGANPGITDLKGDAALHGAAEDSKMISLLLQHGAPIDARDSEGQTVLLRAVRLENLAIARLLLEKGANAGAADPTGDSALHLAAGHSEMAKLLLANGAPVDAKGSEEQTVLFRAVRLRSLETAELLLKNGANIGATDQAGDSTLHIAAGQSDMANMLLRHGAIAEARNHAGQTVLFRAVDSRNPELTELLLKRGADANAVDARGQTVLQLALWRGGNTARLLLNHGAKLTVDPLADAAKRERLFPSRGLWPDRTETDSKGTRHMTPSDVSYWN